ncbi:MAG: isoprenylcysteine carboxylmethyltransferase family protein [Elusimicrobia bacterium]|nr:isoprenylcysteine carboxylmethyltransferase family protein [Elusimicrobiota bacterium]
MLVLAACQPCDWRLFEAGLLVAALGEAVRFWASGHLSKDAALAQDGPYLLIRNPLYFGSFGIAIGFLIAVSNPATWLTTASIWALVLGGFHRMYTHAIRSEEAHLAGLFGDAFDRYRRRTPAFWPRPGDLPQALKSTSFSFQKAKKNKEPQTLAAVLAAMLLVGLKLRFHA